MAGRSRSGEAMKRFDVVEHTADTGIVAYGGDMREAFANAAYGMFSLMADLEQVREETSRYVEADAGDRESLAVSWLNELLYMFDVEGIVFKRFDILELTNTRLKADAYGEKAEASRHGLRGGVKAATYHMLKVSEDRGRWRVRVIFDV
jgi:SHS2 domain-containing protein